jgi:hypothetical protein
MWPGGGGAQTVLLTRPTSAPDDFKARAFHVGCSCAENSDEEEAIGKSWRHLDAVRGLSRKIDIPGIDNEEPLMTADEMQSVKSSNPTVTAS